jgi:Putative MetA-pathway of phenol degradation
VTRAPGILPAVALFVAAVARAFAQGGPPLLTDDPGTPGNHNWEINIASMRTISPGEREFQGPLFDINYGLGDRIQLKYQIAYLFDSEFEGPYRGTPGNSLMGVKWRFYQQSREGGWNISTYPQLELNNPDDAYTRGLVEHGPRFLLPVEISKVFGPLEVNLEAGYWFNREANHERILGLSFGHQFNPKFEALAEIYDDVLLGARQRATTIDFGGRYEFHNNLVLIFMAGRSPAGLIGALGQPSFIAYAGLQVQVKHGRKRRAPNRLPRP